MTTQQTRTRKLPPTPTDDFPYQVEARVGEGGMGVVFRAQEPALGRRVAIKVLRPSALGAGSPTELAELRQRFVQEARSAASISHPGAVTIHRVGQVDGLAYIAMEWLEGETLEECIRRGPLPVPEAIRVAADVLDVLAVAHRAGLVHRDVKPANLMLLGDGRVKVTDFGIARSRRSDLHLTRAGTVLGTPLYASPEQLQGEEVDGRSDLFAVGVVLFEMLTGKLPFGTGPLDRLLTRLLTGSPDPLRTLRPEVPEGLEAVVLGTLSRDRVQRPACAEDLAAALRGMARGGEGGNSAGGDGRPGERSPATSVAPDPSAPTAVLRQHPEGEHPSYVADRADLPGALAQLVASWPGEPMPAQSLRRLLGRLLEPPLHTAAFAGALVVEGTVLLMEDGRLLEVFAPGTGLRGEAALAALPDKPAATLHPAPATLAAGTLSLLAGLLGPARRRGAALTSTVLALPAFREQLAADGFTGVLRLRREGGEDGADGDDGEGSGAAGFVLVVEGRTVLSLYLGAWGDLPVDTPWVSWAGREPLRIEVETPVAEPSAHTWRVRLAGAELVVRRREGREGERSSGIITRRLSRLAGRVEPRRQDVELELVRGAERSEDLVATDPVLRFLRWLLAESPVLFSEKELASRWKYLADWLPRVERLALYPELEPPAAGKDGGGNNAGPELFDATLHGDGRLMHLVLRREGIDRASFEVALQRFLAAKEARLESGDVGGAVLLAPAFPEEVISRYLEVIDDSARGLRRLQETFTGYAGFVRVGTTRGFHLLLVEEHEDGYEPLLL